MGSQYPTHYTPQVTRGETEAPSGILSPASLMKHHVTEPVLANQAKLIDDVAQEGTIIETDSLGSERKGQVSLHR